jgi:hypothetical protein
LSSSTHVADVRSYRPARAAFFLASAAIGCFFFGFSGFSRGFRGRLAERAFAVTREEQQRRDVPPGADLRSLGIFR